MGSSNCNYLGYTQKERKKIRASIGQLCVGIWNPLAHLSIFTQSEFFFRSGANFKRFTRSYLHWLFSSAIAFIYLFIYFFFRAKHGRCRAFFFALNRDLRDCNDLWIEEGQCKFFFSVLYEYLIEHLWHSAKQQNFCFRLAKNCEVFSEYIFTYV